MLMCVMQLWGGILFSIFCGLTKLLKCIAKGVYDGQVGEDKEELHFGVFPKWSRTFIEFSESDKSLKHEFGWI